MQWGTVAYIDLTGDDDDDRVDSSSRHRSNTLENSGSSQEKAIMILDAPDQQDLVQVGGGPGKDSKDCKSALSVQLNASRECSTIDLLKQKIVNKTAPIASVHGVGSQSPARESLGDTSRSPATIAASIIGQEVPAAAPTPLSSLGHKYPRSHVNVNIVNAVPAGASVPPTPADAVGHPIDNANHCVTHAQHEQTGCSDATSRPISSHDRTLSVGFDSRSASHTTFQENTRLDHQQGSDGVVDVGESAIHAIHGTVAEVSQRQDTATHCEPTLSTEHVLHAERKLSATVMSNSDPAQLPSQNTVSLGAATPHSLTPQPCLLHGGESDLSRATHVGQGPLQDQRRILSSGCEPISDLPSQGGLDCSEIATQKSSQSLANHRKEARPSPELSRSTAGIPRAVELCMEDYLRSSEPASNSSVNLGVEVVKRKRLRSLSPPPSHSLSDHSASEESRRSRSRPRKSAWEDAGGDTAPSVAIKHTANELKHLRKLTGTLVASKRSASGPRKISGASMPVERGSTRVPNVTNELRDRPSDSRIQSRAISESTQSRLQRKDVLQTVVVDKPSGKFLLKSSDRERPPTNEQSQPNKSLANALQNDRRHNDAALTTSSGRGSVPIVSIESREDEVRADRNGSARIAESVKRETSRSDRSASGIVSSIGARDPRPAAHALEVERISGANRPEVSYLPGPDVPESSDVACDPAGMTVWPDNDVTLDARIKSVIQSRLQECREDTEYWHQMWLKKSRNKAAIQTQSNLGTPTSVFARMRPLAVAHGKQKSVDRRAAEFQVELLNVGKPTKASSWSVTCSMLASAGPETNEPPNYSHYVSIKNNFLAHNETVLQRWPYFGEDFNDAYEAPGLAENYFFDTMERPRKLDCMLQAERLAVYAQDMLFDIGCSWVHILRFLLEARPNVGSDASAIRALAARESFCDEDFARNSRRWSTLLRKLPAASADLVGRAAVLCEIFQKSTGLRLWHVARRSDYVASLLAATPVVEPGALTCRICMRHNCPYHGEIHESLAGSDVRVQETADDEAVETDIIVPREVNFRQRVEFPSRADGDEVTSPSRERRPLKWWLESGIFWRAEDRPPYYPCSHPGESCSSAQCICFRNNVPCEKMCSCDASCDRKWQGCSCSTKTRKGQKHVCFEDDRCACYGLNRECDPDLCGTCGVCEVLDPLHRPHDTILSGRCNNANIQRGVAKRTLLGTSMVHGFGLYAGQKIVEHDFVGEYKGEIITKSESDRRAAVYEHQKLSYLFSLNKTQEIDSTYFGNKVRFINHADSKKANLYPRIMLVNLVHRIGLFGSRHVKNGEELFFDYGPEFPDEQLGGVKASKKGSTLKAAKSAPRVRNSLLTREFFDVDYRQDALGNRRAVKAGFGGTWDQSQVLSQSNDDGMLPPSAKASSKRRRKLQRQRVIIDDDDDDEVNDSHEENEEEREGLVGAGARNRHRGQQTAFEGWYVNDGLQAMDIDIDASVDGDFEPDDDDDSGSGSESSQGEDGANNADDDSDSSD